MHHEFIRNRRTTPIQTWPALALLSLCVCGLLSAAGCGSGAYAEKFDKRLTELRNASPFTVLNDEPTDDLAINFRVPLAFQNCYDRHSAHPDTPNFRIRSDRVLPPFLASDPSGFVYMFETKWTDPGQEQSSANTHTHLFVRLAIR